MAFELVDGTNMPLPANIVQAGMNVGTLTSVAPQPAGDNWIGLGYLKTAVTDFEELQVGNPPRPITALANP